MIHSALKHPANSKDHRQGSLHAPIVFVMYGDFECEYSGVAAPAFEQLLDEYPTDMCVVYRHFPLTDIHQYAELAALAAEAAGEQFLFWPMHRVLFDNQAVLSLENIFILAESLALDTEQFAADIQRHELMLRLQRDIGSGIRNHISGTPTVFMNNQRLFEPVSYDSLKYLIEEKLSATAKIA